MECRVRRVRNGFDTLLSVHPPLPLRSYPVSLLSSALSLSTPSLSLHLLSLSSPPPSPRHHTGPPSIFVDQICFVFILFTRATSDVYRLNECGEGLTLLCVIFTFLSLRRFYAAEIAEALFVLHHKGIIHRSENSQSLCSFAVGLSLDHVTPPTNSAVTTTRTPTQQIRHSVMHLTNQTADITCGNVTNLPRRNTADILDDLITFKTPCSLSQSMI